MTNRRRLGAALIALGTIAVTVALFTEPVGAQAPDQTGWWFELQTKTLPAPLPQPPNVPKDGLYVQQGPAGPTAYSAVRYRVPNADSATLTLAAADGSTTSLGAPVQACATTAPWTPPPAPPGAWEDAPKYGTQCTLGAISSDGKYLAFFFGSEFFAGDALDVAIVPQKDAKPFALAFNKPEEDSLEVKLAPAGAPPSRPITPTTLASTPVHTGGAVTAPLLAPSPAAAPAPTAAPVTDNVPALANNVLNVAGLGDPDRGARALALGGASLIVVGWWLLSTRAVPMPRLLGALASPAVASEVQLGGVGRFARQRETTPRMLR